MKHLETSIPTPMLQAGSLRAHSPGSHPHMLTSTQVLNLSREEESTAFLGDLFQRSVIL